MNSYFRGTIPRFEIQGTAIADMPVKRTFGHNRILGCKLFDWGQVVLDFRRKRFLFIPRGGEAKAPPQPACNFTLALSAGQLVVGQVWDEAKFSNSYSWGFRRTSNMGMCCTMVWTGVFALGVAVGCTGISVLALAYPMFLHLTKRRRAQLAPQIEALSRELLGQSPACGRETER